MNDKDKIMKLFEHYRLLAANNIHSDMINGKYTDYLDCPWEYVYHALTVL